MIMNSDQSKPYKSSKYFGFVSSRSFQRYQWCYYRSFGVSSKFFFISFFSLLFVICEEAREIKKKKKILKAHWSSGDDITGTVGKISTIWILWHQERSQTVLLSKFHCISEFFFPCFSLSHLTFPLFLL